MAQIIVRNLDDDVRNKLRELAQKHGRSMEEEVRDILRSAVIGQRAAEPGLGSRIAQRFRGRGLTQDIPELRGQMVEPLGFDE